MDTMTIEQGNTTMKTTTEVITRPEAGAQGVTTNLTIDWTDMSHNDILALAQQALVVKLQGAWRKNTIPEGEFEVRAVEFKVGAKRRREDNELKGQKLEKAIAALTPQEIKALIERLKHSA